MRSLSLPEGDARVARPHRTLQIQSVTLNFPFFQPNGGFCARSNDNWGLCVLRNLPNAMSIARIPASLVLLILFDHGSGSHIWISIAVVVAVMASDFFDGRLARRYGIASKLGYLLDGLGDRAFHVAAYLLLYLMGIASIYLVWLLLFREICQYAVRLVDADWHSKQSSTDRTITKTYTVIVQILFLGELLREALVPGLMSNANIWAVNALLLIIAAASFWRLTPKLVQAWHAATHA
jgi:CDP-diacylglycerol---glycerol-3-phosphate 3-phosphatidyltransferase